MTRVLFLGKNLARMCQNMMSASNIFMRVSGRAYMQNSNTDCENEKTD